MHFAAAFIGKRGWDWEVVLLASLRDYDDTTTTAFSMTIMTGTKIDSSSTKQRHYLIRLSILSLALLEQ